MGFFRDLFGPPKPARTTRILNTVGEVILELPVRDLIGTTLLRGKDLSFAVLKGEFLDGSDLEGTTLFGADVRNCSFRRCNLKNANLAYALIDGANFQRTDLDGADLLYTNVKHARFDGATIGPTSTIPSIFAGSRRQW